VFRYRLQGYQIDLMLRPVSQGPEPRHNPKPGDSTSPRRGA
jgi:type VI secretion system protein VasD